MTGTNNTTDYRMLCNNSEGFQYSEHMHAGSDGVFLRCMHDLHQLHDYKFQQSVYRVFHDQGKLFIN